MLCAFLQPEGEWVSKKLVCLVPYCLQLLDQCLAHSTCSINVCEKEERKREMEGEREEGRERRRKGGMEGEREGGRKEERKKKGRKKERK